MRRLAVAVLRLYCIDCRGIVWPWQPRCGSFHTACKHAQDERLAQRNGVPRWVCGICGR